jgi:hypothetical protein
MAPGGQGPAEHAQRPDVGSQPHGTREEAEMHVHVSCWEGSQASPQETWGKGHGGGVVTVQA